MVRTSCENLPYMSQVRIDDQIYTQKMQNRLSKSYKKFGIAWAGKTEEIGANEVGYRVISSLLQNLAKH